MTATEQLNRRLLTGNRPRCSDPVDHQLWTSEHQAGRNKQHEKPGCWYPSTRVRANARYITRMVFQGSYVRADKCSGLPR